MSDYLRKADSEDDRKTLQHMFPGATNEIVLARIAEKWGMDTGQDHAVAGQPRSASARCGQPLEQAWRVDDWFLSDDLLARPAARWAASPAPVTCTEASPTSSPVAVAAKTAAAPTADSLGGGFAVPPLPFCRPDSDSPNTLPDDTSVCAMLLPGSRGKDHRYYLVPMGCREGWQCSELRSQRRRRSTKNQGASSVWYLAVAAPVA